MTKFDNKTVIRQYFNGTSGQYKSGVESHTGNLWIDASGIRLMNYSTCLVEYVPNVGYVYNETKYSSTTSKIQSYIRRELPTSHKIVSGVRQSESWLNGYLPIEEVKNSL